MYSTFLRHDYKCEVMLPRSQTLRLHNFWQVIYKNIRIGKAYNAVSKPRECYGTISWVPYSVTVRHIGIRFDSFPFMSFRVMGTGGYILHSSVIDTWVTESRIQSSLLQQNQLTLVWPVILLWHPGKKASWLEVAQVTRGFWLHFQIEDCFYWKKSDIMVLCSIYSQKFCII